MNAKNDDFPDYPNAQSIVMKVEHRNMANDITHSSVMLCGDTDAVAWKDIMTHYDAIILVRVIAGSYHGSITFFDDPSDEKYYYTAQVKAISPEITIFSVGDNNFGHPDLKAIELYEFHPARTRGTSCIALISRATCVWFLRMVVAGV